MKKYLIIILVIVLLIGAYFFIKLTPVIDIYPAHPLDRLASSQPEDIVFAVENYIYATSTPMDEFANIRWGETGTFRNKDVPAFGAYIQSIDGDLIFSQYNKTKEILEKNSFIKNEANTFGEFKKADVSNSSYSREDTSYQNNNTICTVSISTQPTSVGQKYYLSLKCGTFDGSFEATQR